MAGGVGGFFGHFSERFNRYGPFRPNGPCGYHPGSLKQAFRTHRDFWKNGRLRLSMTPENDRVRDARGYCLATADKKHFVFFVEDADSVTVDLSGMPGRQKCVAVDARSGYKEIDNGKLTAGVYTLHLGAASDWGLAVGDFSVHSLRDGVSNIGNARLPAQSGKESPEQHP